MSSISFDADFQTDKLEAGVKKSKKTITEWIDGVVDAGKRAEAAMDKVPGAVEKVTEKVKEQKKEFKSVAEEMAYLYKEMMKAIGIGDNANTTIFSTRLEELRGKLAAATQAEKDFNAEHTEAIARNNAMGQSTEKLTDTIGKWALNLGGAMAILTVLKQAFLETTQGMKLFNQIGAVTSQVLNDITSGAGLSIERMVSAAKAAGALADMRVNDRIETLKNKDLMREYNELYSKGMDQTISSTDKINYLTAAKEKYTEATKNEIESSKEEEKVLLGIWKNQPTSDKAMANVYAVANKIKDLQSQLSSGTRRLTTQITGEIQKQTEEQEKALKRIHELGLKLQKANAKDDEDAAKKAIEDAKLKNQIKKQEDLLDQAIESGNTAQIKAIGERLAALKKELEVREKIAKQVIDAATFEGFVPTTIASGTIGVPTVFPKIKKAPGSKTPEQINQEMVNLRPMGKEEEEGIKKQEKANKNDEESLKRQLKLREEIFAAITDLTMQLANQLGMSDEAAQAIGTTIDALGKLTTDPVGAVKDAVSMIISLFPSQAAKFADQMALINEAINEAQRLIDISERIGGGTAARQTALDAAKTKQTADELALQKAIDKKNDKIFAFGPVYEADKKAVIELTAAVAEDQAAIDKAQNALTDFMTATNEMNIADAIEQGFEDSEPSAQKFADIFNNFMTKAVNSSLEDMSKTEITAWYEQFAADMKSGGGLSEAEKAALQADWDKIIAEGQANRQAAYDAAGISPTIGTAAQPGLTGIVRNITEDTGNELAGLMRSQRDDIRQMKDYSREGINHLVRLAAIEMNTLNTVTELQRLNGKTDTVISKIGSPYTSPLG